MSLEATEETQYELWLKTYATDFVAARHWYNYADLYSKKVYEAKEKVWGDKSMVQAVVSINKKGLASNDKK